MTVSRAAVDAPPDDRPRPLLEVRSLTTDVKGDRWRGAAVDDVTFTLTQGEVLGIVGESGSGKSLTALSLIGLVVDPVEVVSGEVLLDGADLRRLTKRQLRAVRGARIGMVFQEPLTSLDPSFTIGSQMVEAIRAHRRISRRRATQQAIAALQSVGIPKPAERLKSYPHELSGGMRQRVMLATALLLRPRLLIADEPVTALDVTTQAQVLDLIQEMQRDLKTATIFISHDIGVVLDIADRAIVMYAGQIVELATTADLRTAPMHPYTQALLRSALSVLTTTDRVEALPGQVPPISNRPVGCRFADRCAHRIDRCQSEPPDLVEVAPGRQLRCFNPSPWKEPG